MENRLILVREEELRKTSNHIINLNENFNISQYLILLELSLFVPSFPIGEEGTKFYEGVNLDTKYAACLPFSPFFCDVFFGF
ncbi:hypothetical protein EXW56_04690 [Bacillus mycoides]|nr:hypothetical protein EXW56_04690 [Bacillus mycoides]